MSWAGTTGKLAGKVVDQKSGEPLPGVNVMLLGTPFGAASDLNGNFIMLRIPPGQYSVKTSMIGYSALQYDNVHVAMDRTTRLNFELSETIVELGETVTIIAEKPLVQMDLTSTSSTVSADVISKLPVDRFQDLVNLQAGVVEGSGGEMHIRGGRSGEVAFMIDGVTVNDVFDGDFSLEVENNAIQELEVISGTFNAEYGQAMSGIVNIVTKDGGPTYHGSLSTYAGDYLSTHEDIFSNVEEINPIYNLQGSFGGPVPGFSEKFTFFASGRFFKEDGWIYGKRIFLPSDNSNFRGNDPGSWLIMSQGVSHPFSQALVDSLKNNADSVPLNPQKKWTGQAKLTYQFSPNDKLSYEMLLQRRDFRTYDKTEDHFFRFNPDGNYRKQQRSLNQTLNWNHAFSDRMFSSLKLAHFRNRFEQYVHDDYLTTPYVSTDRLRDASNNAFFTGGQQMWQYRRETRTTIGKLDVTRQTTNIHQIKAGVEGRFHRLWLEEFEVIPDSPTNRKPPRTSFNNNQFLVHPTELSAYVQDKMEFDFMIVNVGLRYDLFNPDYVIPENLRDAVKSPKRSARSSGQLSPRFGIAYPISDRGVIHLSYGHFFQTPVFDFLYRNPEFEVFPLLSTISLPPNSLLNTVGNAELEPQKTVIYEIGLQQQLTEDLALDVTAYLKDIRNLLGTEVLKNLEQDRFARYLNRDYGSVKGFTLALEKRLSRGFSANIDYTFQIARGNASDPNDAFLNAQSDPPIETTKQLVPLDWDRTHSLNVTATAGNPDNFLVGLIGKLGSGFPYTPTKEDIRESVENGGRKPLFYRIDIYMRKNFKVMGLNYSFFLRVFNLTDRKNEQNVYDDTGRAGFSISKLQEGEPRGINTLEEFIIRPDFYSAPRRLETGVSVSF
ncbi:MAG: TonB-dependent receptor domain-containing protein [bacterium]